MEVYSNRIMVNPANGGHVEGLFEGLETREHRDGSHRVSVKVAVPNTYRNNEGVAGIQHVKLSCFIRKGDEKKMEAFEELREGDLLSADFTYWKRRYQTADGRKRIVVDLQVSSLNLMERGFRESWFCVLTLHRAMEKRRNHPSDETADDAGCWYAVSPENRYTDRSFVLEDGFRHYNACNYGVIQGDVESVELCTKDDGICRVRVEVRAPRTRRPSCEGQESDVMILKTRVMPDDDFGARFFGNLKKGDKVQANYQLRAGLKNGKPLYAHHYALMSIARIDHVA